MAPKVKKLLPLQLLWQLVLHMLLGGVNVVVKGVAIEGMVEVGEAMVEVGEAMVEVGEAKALVMSEAVVMLGKADEATGSDCNSEILSLSKT
jgi:hypothetical protein